MKKILKGLVTVFVILSVLICSVFFVSAANSDVSIDFEKGSFGFIAPGDLNADGSVNAGDLVLIKKILLNTNKVKYAEVYSEIGLEAKFSDANGDNNINVIDLVRVKKCVEREFIGKTNGVNGSAGMNIYGNVSYVGGLSTILSADKYYQISFDYKSDDALKLTVNGISNQEYVFKSEPSADWAKKTYLIATAEKFVSTSDIEVKICGNGVVDNITITPCTIDNDFANIW